MYRLFPEEDLVVPDNLTAAIDHLVKILEDAIKTTPARLQRISLTNGLKQFKFICKVSGIYLFAVEIQSNSKYLFVISKDNTAS